MNLPSRQRVVVVAFAFAFPTDKKRVAVAPAVAVEVAYGLGGDAPQRGGHHSSICLFNAYYAWQLPNLSSAE